jgi:glycosyltransferase involved in cell wall biosynthesis
MYHSNVVASVVSAFTKVPVVWNIRHTPYDLSLEKMKTGLLIRLGAWLSNSPAATIYNSRVSAQRHAELGYANDPSFIIPNGFDVARFAPSPDAYRVLRQSLGLRADVCLIGLVARYHPMKDHFAFVSAAEKLSQSNPDVHYVLVGRNVDENNASLMDVIRRANLSERIHLLGQRRDIPHIMAGLDIFTLCSAWGEGFPNVVGEAMACGVPCVVTDVGDSKWVVGDTGVVVPPGDVDALAESWRDLMAMGKEGRLRLGSAARQRIADRFALSDVVRRYENLYLDILE